MASKVENRATIVALSAQLGIAAPENLEQIDKQVDLEALIADLEKKLAEKAGASGAGGADSEATTVVTPPDLSGAGAPPPPFTPTEPESPKKVVATTYAVKLGKVVTTKRGDIGALEPVWPTDFGGGQEHLDHWVAQGYVTKTEHYEQ